MKPSPLQLQHSHFTGLSLVSLDQPEESSDTPYPKFDPGKVKVEISLGEFSNNPDRSEFIVTLGIGDGGGIAGSPYRFAARIEGFFELTGEEPQDIRKRIAVINGGSMLYGIIREQILSLSLRQRNGPLLLPALDFRSLKEAKEEGRENVTSPKAEKPKRSRKKAE